MLGELKAVNYMCEHCVEKVYFFRERWGTFGYIHLCTIQGDIYYTKKGEFSTLRDARDDFKKEWGEI